MKLNLKNPLVFFDLETTGTNINSDRIVEICYLKVYPNGNEESKTMRINPEMHIPEASSAIHGIYAHGKVFHQRLNEYMKADQIQAHPDSIASISKRLAKYERVVVAIHTEKYAAYQALLF